MPRSKLGFKSPQDAVGKVVRSELFEPGTGIVQHHHHRRRRGFALPLRPRRRSTRSCSRTSNKGPALDDRPLSRRSRRRSRRQSSGSGSRSPTTYRSRPSSARTSSASCTRPRTARAQIFAAFALLAVIIGCLGLFGLAAFTAERRTKEIGIRKVLGARTRDIVRLLVWQFSRPVIIANIIAWPVAWWLMRDWLNGFDQRITLTPMPFVIAAAIALGIAIATVVGHAIRVARANPIHALRYE